MLPYRTGSTRNADYLFPARLDSPLIRPGVRLEMGIRGGTLPGTQRRAVTSYIAEFGWDHTARPAGGYAASPVFDAAGPLRVFGAQAYARAQSLL